MLESGLQRMVVLAAGVIVFAVIAIFLFGSPNADVPEEGFVNETGQQVWEQNQARSHKY